jgi:hypothetical protein
MIRRRYPWGKLLLITGLLLVALNGLVLNPLVRRQYISGDDLEEKQLASARDAYLKMQRRLKVLEGLMDDLNFLQNAAKGDRLAKGQYLHGLAFPLWDLAARYFPRQTMNIKLRQAKKERANVARKIEYLEMMCASLERQAQAYHLEDQTRTLPPESRPAMIVGQIDLLRRHLALDKASLKDLAATLSKIKSS